MVADPKSREPENNIFLDDEYAKNLYNKSK
jgi:hypothetical protein